MDRTVALNPFRWPARTIAALIFAFAVFALGSALISQYVFGLRPCILCLYQRVPYGIIIALSAFGVLRPSFAWACIIACGLAFLSGASIAIFHVGVEEQWWRGFEGCSTPALTGSVEDLMKAIENAPIVACDRNIWRLMGLSMAAYNVFASGAAGLGCLIWALINRRRSTHP